MRINDVQIEGLKDMIRNMPHEEVNAFMEYCAINQNSGRFGDDEELWYIFTDLQKKVIQPEIQRRKDVDPSLYHSMEDRSKEFQLKLDKVIADATGKNRGIGF